MIPFRVEFRAGASFCDQAVYAAKRALVTGQLVPGNPFPSVRELSKELKISHNTAAKIVARLVSIGLLNMNCGIGTVVAVLPKSTRRERLRFLERKLERIVIESKRLGISLEELSDSISARWQNLSVSIR